MLKSHPSMDTAGTSDLGHASTFSGRASDMTFQGT